MKIAANEITKGKNLDTNLKKYSYGMMDLYNNYSLIRFSMNYYSLAEMYLEDNENSETLFEEEVLKLVDEVFENENISSEIIERVNTLRNNIINKMKGIISLADIFSIYEYVLNRIEYRFKDGSDILVESDDMFASRIISYILSEKDQMLINTRISEVVRELPVRMTKNKFFELFSNGLKVYKGSEKQSVNDFLYMIRTSAMLDIDENAKLFSEDINEIYKEFRETDYSAIDEETYNNLHDKLTYTTDIIQKNVSLYQILIDTINDLYAYCLSKEYLSDNNVTRQISCKIISMINNKLKDKENDNEEIEELFINLEGKQEEYYRKIMNFSNILDVINDMYIDEVNKYGLLETYKSLEKVEKLESGSSFVEFDIENDTEIADDSFIDSKIEETKNDLSLFFKENSKIVNRAVMANILSSLPIFFGNVDEIKNYITSSISQCTDNAEKLAIYELFEKIMEE